MNIKYVEGRKVDVPVNYLDVSRYKSVYGEINKTSLTEGILKTAEFFKKAEQR